MVKCPEYEGAVLDDRSTGGEAVLISPEDGNLGSALEHSSAGERVVGVELRKGPVKLIAPRLGVDLYQRSAIVTSFRGEGRGRDAHLLHGVRLGGQVRNAIPGVPVNARAVNRIFIILLTL